MWRVILAVISLVVTTMKSLINAEELEMLQVPSLVPTRTPDLPSHCLSTTSVAITERQLRTSVLRRPAALFER